MEQPGFAFHVPPATVPFQGSTSESRTASRSGARQALKTRRAKIETLRQVWREPMTLQAMAEKTGFPLASVCSLKAELELEAVDRVEVIWPDGGRTYRTRWRLRL